MNKRLFALRLSLTLSGGTLAAGTTIEDTSRAGKSGAQADAIKLCERLAGTEREICMRQAQENRGTSSSDRGGAGPMPGTGGGTSAAGAPKAPSGAGASTTSGGAGNRY